MQAFHTNGQRLQTIDYDLHGLAGIRLIDSNFFQLISYSFQIILCYRSQEV